MTAEAHWSVLKRHYLVMHNRPRVDFIIHLMETTLLSKFRNYYALLSAGVKMPRWWPAFKTEWRSLSERALNRNYNTSEQSWICSRPAFLNSRFMMCKHLINGKPIPEYRNLVRARHPPFLSFERREGRRYAELECLNDPEDISPSGGIPLLQENSIFPMPNATNMFLEAKSIRNELV